MKSIRIAPSILAADPGRLREEVWRVEAAGADMIHVDVMDAHFVPNLAYGTETVAALRKVTTLPLDLHLMIMEPETYAPVFADAGADSITFHAEAVAADHARKRKERGWAVQGGCKDCADRPRLEKTIGAIRGKGKKVCVALNPDTEPEALDYLDRVDMVLAMTVWPGFGGQKFIEGVLPKVARMRKLAPKADIEVDGGVDLGNVERCASAGANVLVAGTSVFCSPDPGAAIRDLRVKAERAYGV
jgi:ribulose-phosphate 3-epimerase